MEKVLAIALTTYRESIRGKALYSILLFALLMLIIALFFGSITIGDQVIVIKDFGLFATSLFSVAFAVISGTALLSKELARKTIYNILSKPVSRSAFLWGKFLGLFATTTVMIVLMALGLTIFLSIYQGAVDTSLFAAYPYQILELAIVCATAIFFSSILVTPSLSGMLTFAIFLAGRSVDYILILLAKLELPDPVEYLLRGVYWILPHLTRLTVSDRVVFGEAIPSSHLLWSSAYVAGYCVALLIISSYFFQKREFN